MINLKSIAYIFILTITGNAMSETWVDVEIVKIEDVISVIGSRSSDTVTEILESCEDEIRDLEEWLEDEEDTIKIKEALTNLINGDYPKSSSNAIEYSHALEFILQKLSDLSDFNTKGIVFSPNIDWDDDDEDSTLSLVLRKLNLNGLADFWKTLKTSYRLPVPMPDDEDGYLSANYLTHLELEKMSQELAGLNASNKAELLQEIEKLDLDFKDDEPYAEFIWQLLRWADLAQKSGNGLILFYKSN